MQRASPYLRKINQCQNHLIIFFGVALNSWLGNFVAIRQSNNSVTTSQQFHNNTSE